MNRSSADLREDTIIGVDRRDARPTARDRLRTLQSVTTTIVRSLDLDATLLAISNAAQALLAADAVGIMSVESGVLKMQSCVGHRNIDAVRFHAQKGEGVAGIVLQTGRPHRIDDFHEAATISAEIKRYADNEGVRCSQGAPMLADGEVTGVVLAWSRTPFAFDDEDQEVLEGLANLAVIAIKNASLYETTREAAANLEAVNRRLEEQCDLLNGAASAQAELTDLMLRGEGLSALVDMVARYTAGEVAVLDPELELLAVTADGDQVAEQARGCVRSRRHQAADETGTAADLDEGHLLVREVSSGGQRMGYLCVGLVAACTKLIPLIVEQAAVACALELTKQRAILDARVRVRSDFLWELLEGKIGDVAEANVRARYLGYTLPRKLRVMQISVAGLDEWAQANGIDADAVDQRRSVLLGKFERLAAETGSSRVLSARRASALALVVPWLEDVDEARKFASVLLRGLVALEPDLRFSIGVSACHDLSGDLSGPLGQARTALASVTPGTSAPIALFDDLGILRFLLAPGDRGDLADFVRRMLGAVIRYDQEHSTQLLETLEAYFAEDRNLGRTAEHLYIHAKTVRYRLDRIQELAKRDLAVQHDCFDLQLALHIMWTLDMAPNSRHCGEIPAEPKS
ncbi:helix-turn-helix domain-containing protein [Amycolatopsis benzoatilytica]|uniref:helix-turn-helix domain-containing protein n=1 Tax=Amycolatopsis benzoatilytica TaxID=346045 RepID=UPI00035EFE8A|nr:helix-turn-helix domain-containing protein [Amycolatopsis benzoatilytica]